jgi:hypothetical protein
VQSFIWDVCCQTPHAALPPKADTALHTSRNFAVSPFDFAEVKPCLIRRLFHCWNSSPLGSDVTARIPRLTADGRYPLPGCLALSAKRVFGLSSPISPTASGCEIEYPEPAEGLSLDFARDAQFWQLPAAGKIGATTRHRANLIIQYLYV